MIVYQTNFTNTNNLAFPNTAARDVSVQGAGDGTEFKSLMPNDVWGYRQAIMNYAGLTPNNVSEVYNNSQILEALKLVFSPVGMVVGFYGQSDPATLGLRFLSMEGQTILVSSYSELVTVCYIGDGSNSNLSYESFYKCSDTAGLVRTTAGPYFKIPDTRGKFLRGTDPTSLRDPQGVSRAFPGEQEWATQTHYHRIGYGNADPLSDGQNKVSIQGGTGTAYNLIQQDPTLWGETTNYNAQGGFPIPSASNPYNTDANETRVWNNNIKWLLRY